MVWSGTTKYLRTVVKEQGKPCEFPNFAIFNPVCVDGDLAASRLNASNLNQLDSKDKEIELQVNKYFVDGCNAALRITERSGYVKIYDPQSRDQQSFLQSVNHINMASIAKVCDTDVFTVQQVFSEIVAQLRSKIKKGCNLRLLFKFGRLATRNGEINWR